MFEGFEERTIATSDSAVFARIGGSGPPLLLIHGFPETHLMWRDVAPSLGKDFTVVCVDLRGQGASGCPESSSNHYPYSKRAMAAELIEVMRRLGHLRFAVAGHDRGARVGYRMALDHEHAVQRLAVLDVIPIADAWRSADSRLTLSFWPWSLLSQPAPLPERLISRSPDAIVEDAVSQWGTPANCFPPDIREAYAAPLGEIDRAHAICEEFRSAATLDREHDEADLRSGRKIRCPLLLLWDGSGALASWYEDLGGPIGVWRRWAENVRGRPMAGGHFFPESESAATASELRSFFLERT